jgi:hypothetical protein
MKLFTPFTKSGAMCNKAITPIPFSAYGRRNPPYFSRIFDSIRDFQTPDFLVLLIVEFLVFRCNAGSTIGKNFR